jgi:hypothetical protein
MEEAELEIKMRHAKEWCKRVSELSKYKWFYFKISKSDFEKYKNQKFSILVKSLIPKEIIEEKIAVKEKPKEEMKPLGLFQRIKNWLVNLWKKIFK